MTYKVGEINEEEVKKELKAESKKLKADASNAQNHIKQHKKKAENLSEELEKAKDETLLHKILTIA